MTLLFQLMVHYESTKEVRTFKQDFYQMLFHMTRQDYQNILRSASKVPQLFEAMHKKWVNWITAMDSTIHCFGWNLSLL